MAQIFPSFENIQRLKVPPTEGELFLLNYLVDKFDENVEVYFQPFLNGDRPDIILMKKDSGVVVIEVKDWDLSCYKVDKDNGWHLKNNNTKIKSPFQQVFGYKNNLFNLHINGLLEKKIKNENFYNVIDVYVYFHEQQKDKLDKLYSDSIMYWDNEIKSNNSLFKNNVISHEKYEKNTIYLASKKKKLERDKFLVITNEKLKKLSLLDKDKILFDISIYYEFKRYLQPPFHVLEQGREIIYEKKQLELSESKIAHQKIKGVAGSGKTTVLAKRAVNSHKRHGERVLILTYNITLKSYVHDKISDVRENFSWDKFYITTYHQLVLQVLNELNIVFEIPDNMNEDAREQFWDENYYSNIAIFEDNKAEIHKYKSIFIDEIQDYKPEWIKIIRTYFLEDDSEMVLFGDEKQNIYERAMDDEKKPRIPNGFGKWEYLKKSIRNKQGSPILNLAESFQKCFFDGKYELDVDAENKAQIFYDLVGINKVALYSNYDDLVSTIFEKIKKEDIQPNDVCILSSKISPLREIDYLIRTKFNEKTLTTFESKEIYESHRKEISNLRKNKKIGFNLNSGVIKLSTIHSFKGFEAPTVFLIINNKYNGEDDHGEMVYTGITRAKFNLMVFLEEGSKYTAFFTSVLENEIKKPI